MEYPYRYRLSVSADMNAHIGSLTDILKSNFLNKRLYFKNILILKVKKKHQMWVCKSIPQVPNFFLFQEKIIFYFIFYRNILFIVYRLSVSVSADMGKFISVFYRYQPIRKLSVSGFIGIGQYEKKLISCTLYYFHSKNFEDK